MKLPVLPHLREEQIALKYFIRAILRHFGPVVEPGVAPVPVSVRAQIEVGDFLKIPAGDAVPQLVPGVLPAGVDLVPLVHVQGVFLAELGLLFPEGEAVVFQNLVAVLVGAEQPELVVDLRPHQVAAVLPPVAAEDGVVAVAVVPGKLYHLRLIPGGRLCLASVLRTPRRRGDDSSQEQTETEHETEGAKKPFHFHINTSHRSIVAGTPAQDTQRSRREWGAAFRNNVVRLD